MLRRALLATLLAVLATLWLPLAGMAGERAPLSIHIAGNHFVDGSGAPVRLLGVNRSGTEYECTDGKGIFDGPSDAASIAAMASWHINAVRVPLNEDCWLGINNAPAAFSGSDYQRAITDYVGRLHAAGLYAIVDLHWSAPGSATADSRTGQGRQMADADHAPAFWRSVAATFRHDPATVFDLYNEPHDISWPCWRHGCRTTDPSGSWQTAGFQTLIDAVRSSGASNPVLVAGNRWAGDLRGWPNGLADPMHEMAASWHVYSPPGTRLDTLKDFVVRPLLARYPVVIAELGEKDCAHGWLDDMTSWADGAGISYLAWTWDTWPDCSNPVLISAYDGTPTPYGVGYFDHLTTLWRDGTPARVLSAFDAYSPLGAAAAAGVIVLAGIAAAALFTLRYVRGHH